MPDSRMSHASQRITQSLWKRLRASKLVFRGRTNLLRPSVKPCVGARLSRAVQAPLYSCHPESRDLHFSPTRADLSPHEAKTYAPGASPPANFFCSTPWL